MVRVDVRAMTEADIDAVAELHVRAWQAAYRGIMPQDFLDRMDPARMAARRRETFDPGGQLVAEADGGLLGWAWVGPYRDDEVAAPRPGCGEVYTMYARPDRIGTGVGRALMTAGLGELRRRGLRPVLLWVSAANEVGRRFYDRAGFVPDGATQDFTVGGATLPEVRYRYDG